VSRQKDNGTFCNYYSPKNWLITGTVTILQFQTYDPKLGPQKKYQLPIFVGTFTGKEDDDFQEDICEGMEHSTWTALFNVGKAAFITLKTIAEGRKSMVHGNSGKEKAMDPQRKRAYDLVHAKIQHATENFSRPTASRLI
jgi:hypothetical protein